MRNFECFGWQVARQRGAMTKAGETVTLSVPYHSTVGKGTLRSLIRSAELTVTEF